MFTRRWHVSWRRLGVSTQGRRSAWAHGGSTFIRRQRIRWKEGGEEKDQPPRCHLVRRDDDCSVGDDEIITCIRLVLFSMALAVPFGAKHVEPLGVIPQKSSEQVEEEKVLLASAGPPPEPSRFLTPDTPFTLTGHDTGYAHAADDAVSRKLYCFPDIWIEHQGVGLHPESTTHWRDWCISKA